MVRRLPSLLSSSFRLAWQADRSAARTVLAAEVGRGLAQAVSLLAVNTVLARLMAGGPVEDRLRDAAPALITHRLASVRHADLVHVLDQGRLVESGSPEELLATGGVYTELYSLQAEQCTAKVPTREAG